MEETLDLTLLHKTNMKTFLKNIWSDWTEVPMSVRFWNCLFILLMLALGIYDMNYLAIVWFIGSILIVAKCLDGDDFDNHLWALFMPITWIAIIGVGIGFLLYTIYKHTILRFNDWLDKDKNDERN